MARTLLTVTDYGRHRANRGLAGGSHTAVQRAIESERITTVSDEKGRVRIDPEVADIQWATKTDPVKSAATNGPMKPLGPEPQQQQAAQAEVRTEGTGSEYWLAKTRREIAEAQRSEIEARKAAGDLVHRRSIEDVARQCARAVRDSVMGVPERTAPLLGLDAAQERTLTDALRVALDDAAKLAEAKLAASLPAQMGGT
jgi:hypothetical protein